MSSVWAAWDLTLERPVALKLLSGSLVFDAAWRERFSIEARNIARVHHENVVQVHSFGTHQGWPYFVMDFIDGITLTEWRSARAKPSVSEVVVLVEQIARGLDAVHAAGLVHHDVKPANVLLDRNGHVTLLDLGLSAALGRAAHETGGAGTPSYMAPEQVEGIEVPAALASRTDVYQLGVTTFELLVGEVPFTDDDIASVLEKHRSVAAPLASSVRRDIGSAIDSVVEKALAKNPEDRYVSASSFANALRGAEDEAADRGVERPIRVLVAEDDPLQLTATCAVLAARLPRGSTVHSVHDGEAAVELAKVEPLDAMVLDLHMPYLGAVEVVRKLEALGGRKPYVVVVTGEGGSEEWRRLRAHGVDGILLKPFDADDLVSMISRHISAEPAVSSRASISGIGTRTARAGEPRSDLVDEVRGRAS